MSSKIGDFSKMETQELDALRATDGSRSSIQVNKIDGEHAEGLPWNKMMACELKDRQIYESSDVTRNIKVARRSTRSKFLSVEGRWPVVATMASMVWMGQGSIDVEVLLVLLVVVTTNGDEWWRQWVAGVVDTEGADVEVTLCRQW